MVNNRWLVHINLNRVFRASFSCMLQESIKGPAHTHTHTHVHQRQIVINYQSTKSKKMLQLTLLLICVLMRGSITMPAVDHCLTRFEESLKKTMALRESCEEANLKDCCQVRYYYPLLRVCSIWDY